MLYQLLFQCPTLAGAHATQVFQAEYNLMCDIASCPVPYVSLCDGIWMGLGVGLAVHGNVSTALAPAARRLTQPPKPVKAGPSVSSLFSQKWDQAKASMVPTNIVSTPHAHL